jgi:hypothetical protein
MNELAPPKAKRRLWRTALQELRLSAAYHALNLVQAPFGFVFWKIEQATARLRDKIESGGVHDE